MKSLRCPNAQCPLRAKPSWGMIVRFGFYPTRWGKRRRFRCKMCRRTFCRNRGTVYHRLQHRRATFDEVAALSAEGVNKSAIARVQQIAWNTVDRWLEKAAAACRRFNHQKITKIRIRELQVDEIRAMVGGNGVLSNNSNGAPVQRSAGLPNRNIHFELAFTHKPMPAALSCQGQIASASLRWQRGSFWLFSEVAVRVSPDPACLAADTYPARPLLST